LLRFAWVHRRDFVQAEQLRRADEGLCPLTPAIRFAKRSKNPGLTLSFFILSIKDFGVFLFLAASFFQKKLKSRHPPIKKDFIQARTQAKRSKNPGKEIPPSETGGKDFLVKNKNYVPKKQTNCIFILSLSVFF